VEIGDRFRLLVDIVVHARRGEVDDAAAWLAIGVHNRGRAFGGAERPEQEHHIDPRQACVHSVRFGEVAGRRRRRPADRRNRGAGQCADGDTGFQQPVDDVPADLAGRPGY
jgi:hypothetical protein